MVLSKIRRSEMIFALFAQRARHLSWLELDLVLICARDLAQNLTSTVRVPDESSSSFRAMDEIVLYYVYVQPLKK